MKNCFLFPGQGAQYPGMGKDLWESSGKVKELFDTASEVVKMNLKDLLFKGSEEELKATDKTQVTVTLVNLAAGIALKERGIEASGCAGFSLGEYSALHEAGVIGLEELFSIGKSRGELMEKASRNLDARAGAGGGRAGMAAVLGLPYEEAVGVLEKLAGEVASPAQWQQVVRKSQDAVSRFHWPTRAGEMDGRLKQVVEGSVGEC